jgi:hypothetical protein
MLGGDPGNAILLNGVLQTANLEIGVPGFQPQVPTSTSEFRLRWKQKGRQFLPDGSLRRSSSKKLKMKLTLFTAAVCSVPGAFNTAKRLPSGCRSKL